MSAPLNLPELQRLVKELENARAGRAKAQRLLDVLQLKADKTSVVLSLSVSNERGGDREENAFRLIEADFCGHRIAKGREVLLAHIQRFALEQFIDWSSRVEGAEFQIRRVTKGGAP